ncbi:hypothetical protein INT45_006363 [Circinella minor]|uniref:TOG domain-containing protein n=1 Tax=Circinella minor TaxID=1195481 RepID=A0A8H7VLC9_9FUNG|nr:hypothetical protein INT45_006363 [Circinella minor]
MKETERYLSSMLKHFDGKESEANWEAREQTIIRLREFVQSTNTPEEKNSLARWIRSYGDAIGQSVQSLRTTLVLSALGLVEDIGTHLGNDLDPFTTDLLFIRMLRCASTLKKIIAKHSMDACTSYLSNIPYRNRIMQQITESMSEKNIQLRHHATIYLKTILETHATSVAIEKSGGLDLAEKAIKKALSDASPMVRESCRKLFLVLQTYWPGRASRLLQSLDSNVQKSLDKITNTKPIMKRPNSYRSSISSVSSFSTVSTVSTCSSWSSASTTSSISSSRPSIRSRLYSQPTLRTNSTLSHLPSSQNPSNVPSPSRSSIASSSSSSHTRSAKLASLPPPMRRIPRKRVHEEEQDDVKLKTQRQTNDRISNADKNINCNNNSSNRSSNTVMDYEQEEQYSSSHLAKATLLQMLKSTDVDSNCRAIRRLSKKLKGLSNLYQDSYILPNDVPSSMDLQPILIKYMSYETDNSTFWKTLMSWDCLVAVYTRMIHIQHYIPALILVSQGYNNRVFSQQQRSSINKTCQIGLRRLRSYLTSYDPELPKHLLQVLDKVSVIYNQDPQQRDTIILYIIEWMDEIVCEYVGLGMDNEEQDDNIIMQVKEGSDYYFEQDGHPAYPWFEDETNMRQVISRVLSMLETIREEECGGEEDEEHGIKLYKTLKTLVSRLRLSNERVFDPYTERFEVVMQTPPHRSSNKNSSDDNSPLMGQDWKFDDDTIDAIPDDEGENSEGVESTGATQEFSKMDLQVNKNFRNVTTGTEVQVADLEIPSAIIHKQQQLPPSSSLHQEKLDHKLRDALSRSLEEPVSQEKFVTWQELSARYPVYHPMDQSSTITPSSPSYAAFTLWTDDGSPSGPFIVLFEKIMATVVHVSEQDQSKAIDALRLVKSLLRNQPAVLKYYEGVTTNKSGQASSSSISYLLAEFLLTTVTSSFIKLSSLAETAFEDLLFVLLDNQKLQIIWLLLGEWLKNNEQKSAVRVLFVYLSKFATTVENTTLESSLDPNILIKGYNHTELVVRRACVQAIVEIHKVLGEDFLKTYLAPSLRVDQVNLLRHYIGN